MMPRTTFLVIALLLLILANVIMMSYTSPVFYGSAEGFSNYMNSNQNQNQNQNQQQLMNQNQNQQQEGFANMRPGGAKDAYEAIGPFDGVRLGEGKEGWRHTAPNEPLRGLFPKFQVGPDNLFMFKDNQCKPECCGSSYSCDGGCVCTTPEQRKFVNERGGNRTSPESGV
jgi:hypothetical protein